jgi:hypothetical protein
MQTAEDVSEGTGNAKCKYQTCPYFLLCRNGCALSLARVENPAFRAIGAVSGRLEVANGKADWLEAATASGRGRPARLMSEHSVLETEPCQESNGRHISARRQDAEFCGFIAGRVPYPMNTDREALETRIARLGGYAAPKEGVQAHVDWVEIGTVPIYSHLPRCGQLDSGLIQSWDRLPLLLRMLLTPHATG